MAEKELTLYGLVKAAYKRHVNKQAVLYDDGDSRTSISYKQLWDIASQIKKVLSGRENEVLGLCLKIDHRMPAILLGILGSDAAFYNFDVRGFTYAAQVLEEIGAQNILIHQTFKEDIQGYMKASQSLSIPLNIPYLEDYLLVTLPALASKKYPPCLAYCITTSGTTGKPKVVMVPSQCIVPNIIHLRKLFSLTSSDLVLGATALTFDPSIVEIFMTLSVGACLLIVPPALKMMPDFLLDMIHERNKVTVVQITPTLLSRFNVSRLSQTILGDNSAMRVIALGGERFPSCTWLRSMLSPSNRTHFYNLYGTTEVSCWATCYHVTEEDLRNGAEVPLGEPLLNTVVEVQDDVRKVVTEGEGRLLIGGRDRQCLLNGTEALQFDKLILRDTGDIVRVRGDGKLFYIGRRDQQTKRNGQRINLEEIKMVGRGIETVHDCEVMFIQDQLIGFIVLSQETAVQDVKVIEECMKKHLPSHWWPDSIMLISNLPITEHGKVDFISLEKLYRERQAPACTANIADYLALKWKEFIPGYREGQVLETDNFILTGGDSLKAVQLANVIENCLSLQLPMLIDKILHKTYKDVRQYLTCALVDSVKQCVEENCVSNNSTKNILNLTSDKTADIGSDVLKTDNNFKSVVDKHKGASESDDGVKVSLAKRKLAEHHMVNKILKCMNNFKFSIGRCNRFSEITIDSSNKNDQRGVSETITEKNEKLKTFCAEVNNHSKDIMNCELSLEEVWRYDTGKCVDASPLVAVKSSGDYIVMIGSHSHIFTAICGSSGEKEWEITLPDRIESSACLSRCGNFVIVGCYNGKVYILRVDTGEVWWHFETGSQVKCSPVMDTDTGFVYIGSHSQKVYCLNVNERVMVWHRSLESGSVFSSPAISSDPYQLYVATLGGKLFALNPATGVIIWEYSFKKPVFSSLTVTEAGVLVGCTDKHLYHIKHNGELIWKFSTEGLIFSSPSVFKYTKSMAYPPSENKIHEAKSGYKTAASSTECSVMKKDGDTDMPSMNEYILVGSHHKCLYCISSNGELVWKLLVNSEVYSSPFQCIIDNNNTDTNCDLKENVTKKYVQTSKESYEETDIENSWSESTSHDSCSCTVSETSSEVGVSENNIKSECLSSRTFSKDAYKLETEYHWNADDKQHVAVFATTKGTLYIVHVPTGKILCRKHLEGEIFSSPVMYKNDVIVGCRNDFVYCFKISQ